MFKLLQITVDLNLSIGKISQAIGEKAMEYGWESWITYSARFGMNESQLKRIRSNVIKCGSIVDTYLHYIDFRLFDNEGLASKKSTRRLIEQIKLIDPDIIQLHDIHDHWINYPILLDCLAKLEKPVVWVQHDCWAFTGGCMYFDMIDCEKWKTGCISCPEKRTLLLNQAERNFNLKKKLLAKVNNLTFISVSDWIGNMLKVSVQMDRPIKTIHNGIDLSKFKPCAKKRKDGKFRILGVAAVWNARKGFSDFIKLRTLLSYDYEITLVGLSQKMINNLPPHIFGIRRTTNIDELAMLYSKSDVYVLPTYSDNYPTTNLEALACGTPVITYNTGGSPEAIDEKTGVVVEQGNIEALAAAIVNMRNNPLSSKDCRERAEQLFDEERCFEKYMDLYYNLLSTNRNQNNS